MELLGSRLDDGIVVSINLPKFGNREKQRCGMWSAILTGARVHSQKKNTAATRRRRRLGLAIAPGNWHDLISVSYTSLMHYLFLTLA